MKTKLHFFLILTCCISLCQSQENEVNISMSADYANDVYYKLSNGTTHTFDRNLWDIAFYRAGAAPYYTPFAIRINDGAGIKVFDASNDPADWNSIDIANEGDWTELHNSETSWTTGAFDQGSADGTLSYGWGNYNILTHVIEGDVVFVLKYNDGTYRKFFIDSYAAGYTFTYSTWNGTDWNPDTTVTLPNTNNPNNIFNYYSLQNNTEVVAEPESTDWDIKFTKYATDYYGDGSLFYPVVGVLHNEKVTVAQNEETSGMPTNPSLNFSNDINTIGFDWKSINASYQYEVNPNSVYYIKYEDNTVYRLHFTSFEGNSTGNLSFNLENVSSLLSIDSVNKDVSFGLYPNPSVDKKVTLVYNLNNLSNTTNNLTIYSTTGSIVFNSTLSSSNGFYNKELDLSHLKSGMYIVRFTSGNQSMSQKLILN